MSQEAIQNVHVGAQGGTVDLCDPRPGWAWWQGQPLGQELLGGTGCVCARAVLTPLLQEQTQRYFILCTFV